MTFWKAIAAAMTGAALIATPALSQSTGFAEFVAQVGADATFTRGSGVSAVAPKRKGVVIVTFSRSVEACYALVSVTGKTGYASSAAVEGAPTQIAVSTFDTTGAVAKRDFNILVRCQD